MTSRYTNRAVAGGAPIRLVPTWASLASIEDGVCLVEDSGWVVARDHRLIANQWVPYEACAPDSAWTMATNIHWSTLNPASLPAGWTATATVSIDTDHIVVAASTAVYFRYTFGAAGTINRLLVVSSGAYGNGGTSSSGNQSAFGLVNLNNRKHAYWIKNYTGSAWTRGYHVNYTYIGVTNVTTYREHIQYWGKPLASDMTASYGSHTSVPDEHANLVDQGIDGYENRWQANTADDYWEVYTKNAGSPWVNFYDVILYYQ